MEAAGCAEQAGRVSKSDRKSKTVLLLLNGLEVSEPPHVLLYVRLVHLVIGRDQDLREKRTAVER